MPLPPYTWQLDDFLTATLLNSELYGLGFALNGQGFHAIPPLYASSILSGVSLGLSSGSWTPIGQNNTGHAQNAVIKADTSAMYGARMDPGQNGTYKLRALNAGGTPGSIGGLGLATSFSPVAAGAGTIRSGIGMASGAGPAATGTSQQGNSGLPVAPWSADIIDLAQTDPVTGFILSTQTSPVQAGNSIDGSGRVIRQSAHWLSVYANNGSQVGSAPAPRSSWAGSTALTASLLNGSTGIVPMMKLLNMPPVLRVASSAATTAIVSGTATAINLAAATYDTYTNWSNANDQYTVPLSGLWLCIGFVSWDSIGTTTTRAGIQVNGTSFWGPRNQALTGQVSAAGKAAVLDLNSGDLVKLVTQQFSGSNQSTSSSTPSLLLMVYLGALGAPGTLPAYPDVTYTWQAGTPGASMAGLLTSHLANDLNFLNQRPYFLGSQTVAQNYTAGTDFTVSMQTVGGLVHASAGDPYSGWDSSNKRYVAPRNGWYLAVQETFFDQPNNTTGVAAAKFQLSVPGNSSVDAYQAQNMPTSTTGGGGTAVGYYYLRAGDWIEPVANQSIGTTGVITFITGVNSHFEVVWVSE
jgi:hypothetical protein